MSGSLKGTPHSFFRGEGRDATLKTTSVYRSSLTGPVSVKLTETLSLVLVKESKWTFLGRSEDGEERDDSVPSFQISMKYV